jgi:hypothetical protein
MIDKNRSKDELIQNGFEATFVLFGSVFCFLVKQNFPVLL